MQNGYLRYYVVSTYLDNDTENQSKKYVQTLSMVNSQTVYQGETFAVSRMGISIQKLLFCI